MDVLLNALPDYKTENAITGNIIVSYLSGLKLSAWIPFANIMTILILDENKIFFL